MKMFLTNDELCKLLKVKPTYLWDLRHKKLTPYIKIGGLVRYCVDEIEKWIRSGRSGETIPNIVRKKVAEN